MGFFKLPGRSPARPNDKFILPVTNFFSKYLEAAAKDTISVAEIGNRSGVDKQFSRLEFTRSIERISSSLSQSIEVGSTALLVYPPGVEFITTFLACLRSGVIAVPVPSIDSVRAKRTIPRLLSITTDAAANVILTSDNQKEILDGFHKESANSGLNDLTIISSSELQDPKSLGLEDSSILPARACELAYLQYTSGSTGTPKGVEITHEALIRHCELLRDAWGYTDESVSVTWMPHFHDYGLIDGLMTPLLNGTPTYILSPVGFLKRPFRWLEAISELGGTHTQAPNFAYDYCCSKIKPEDIKKLNLASAKVLSNGAEPVRKRTLDNFYDVFKAAGLTRSALFPAYGLAEATLLVATKPKFEAPRTISVDRVLFETKGEVREDPSPSGKTHVSCGPPILDTEVKIVDPGTMVSLGEGKVGEIWVRSPALARGYWGQSELSAQTFSGKLAQGSPEASYLRTGDLGFLFGGELYPTGRIKDLLILNGANVYPQDIEELVSRDIPSIRRDCVAAFTIDGRDSEELGVMVEIKPRVGDLDRVRADVYKAITAEFDFPPSTILIVGKGDVQKTSSGKIQRSKCRKMWQDGALTLLLEWHSSASNYSLNSIRESTIDKTDATRWLMERIADLVLRPLDQIDPDASFSDLGLDSKGVLSLVGDIEEQFLENQEFPVSLMWEHPTPSQLSKLLAQTNPLRPESVEPNVVTPKQEEGLMSKCEVAVVGLSCRFPGADGPSEFWELLQSGSDAIHSTPRERNILLSQLGFEPVDRQGALESGGFLDRIEYFDAEAFGISSREASLMDPQQRLILEEVKTAFERAAINPDLWRGRRVGVYMGIANDDYGRLIFQHPETIGSYSGSAKSTSIIANRVSYLFDFRGPSMTIDTACSSSLVAAHLAIRALQSGECDLAVVGGANLILDPVMDNALRAGGMLSVSGDAKVFDLEADGYVRGEGVGVVILRRMADAIENGNLIHASVVSSAINQDGASNGLTAPNPKAQVEVMRSALHYGDIGPDEVLYVEAHGTGTPLGDPIEIGSINQVYGRDPQCPVGSVKSVIGHLEGAAGIAGFIKSILVLENRTIPAQANLLEVSPRVIAAADGVRIARSTERLPSNRSIMAAVSSFGFGGANAHVVLKSAPHQGGLANKSPVARDVHTNDGPLILPLSAHSEPSLRSLIKTYKDILVTGDLKAAVLCFFAATGRSAMKYRVAPTGENVSALIENLGKACVDRRVVNEGALKKGGVSWLFSGQGSQFSGMGMELMKYPVFARSMESCALLLKETENLELFDLLTADDDVLRQTQVSQLAIFSVEYSLAQLYLDWGMEPHAVVGHSLGELTAACVAGAFSLEEMLPFVGVRARLMGEITTPGAMAAIRLSVVEAEAKCQAYDGVEIAAVNGPSSVVVSGDKDQIDEFIGALRQQKIRYHALNVSHAFHSEQIAPILEELKTAASRLQPRATKYPLYSNLTGKCISGKDLTPHYWSSHARNPVLFGACIEQLIPTSGGFLEVGPGRTLTSLLLPFLDNLDESDQRRSVGGLSEDENPTLMIHNALSIHFELGSSVNWAKALTPHDHFGCTLPEYPFVRKPYWLKLPPNKIRRERIVDFKLGSRLSSPAANLEIVQGRLSEAAVPFLREHVVFGRVVVPGAGILSLLADVSPLRSQNGESFNLEDVIFTEPLSFESEESREIQLTMPFSNEAAEVEFTLSSFRTGSPENSFLVHAQGRRVLDGNSPKLVSESLASILGKHDSEIRNDFYQTFWQSGIVLGERFRWVQSISIREGEILTELRCPAEYSSNTERLTGLLDSVFQGLLAGVSIDHDSVLVPFAIDEVSINTAKLEDQLWVRIRYEDDKDSHVGLRADLQMFLSTGLLVGQILGFRARRVESGQWEKKKGVSGQIGIFAQEWSKRTKVRPFGTQYQKFIVISADEKLGGTLLKRLRAEGVSSDSTAYFQNIREFCEATTTPGAAILDSAGKTAILTHVESLSNSHSMTSVTDDVTDIICDLDMLFQCTESAKSAEVLLATPRGLLKDSAGPDSALVNAAVGYARSARKETLDGHWRIIDTDPEWTREKSCERLCSLLVSDLGDENEIACRGDHEMESTWVLAHDQPRKLIPKTDHSACLVTGGLGGLGLACAKQLADAGAKTLWLVSRGKPGTRASEAISGIEASGVRVFVRNIDVADGAQVSEIIQEIRDSGDPLTTIYHCAGVLEDRRAGNNSRSTVAATLRPKLLGALNLDQATRADELGEFVLFSSITATLGNRGQTNYGAANNAMAAVAESRARRNAPVTVIDWGPWQDVGMAAQKGETFLKGLVADGYRLLPTTVALDLMKEAILSGQTRVAIGSLPDPSGPLADSANSATSTGPRGIEKAVTEFSTQLKRLPRDERATRLAEYLMHELDEAIKGSNSQGLVVDNLTPLFDVGLDSLGAVEIRNRVSRELGLKLRSTVLFDYPNIQSLSDFLADQIGDADSGLSWTLEAESDEYKQLVDRSTGANKSIGVDVGQYDEQENSNAEEDIEVLLSRELDRHD